MSDHTTKSQNIRAISKRLWSTPLADGSILFVQVQQLWDMAAGLPRKKVRVSELNVVDEVRWFSEAKSKIADGLVVFTSPVAEKRFRGWPSIPAGKSPRRF
jgi:tricorn protease-like protein